MTGVPTMEVRGARGGLSEAVCRPCGYVSKPMARPQANSALKQHCCGGAHRAAIRRAALWR